MKSIKTKILLTTLIVLLLSLSAIGSISAWLNYQSAILSLEQTMTETVQIAAMQVEASLQGYKTLLLEISANDEIISNDGNTAIKELWAVKKRHGFNVVARTNVDGISMETQDNLSKVDYFLVPKETGKPYISDPVMNVEDGTMSIFVSAPIYQEGEFGGIVFAGIDASYLCEIVAGIQIGETGNAAMLNKKGTTIAYADVQLVLDQYNTQEQVQNDPSLVKLAAIEQEMTQGKVGFGEYSYGGQNKLMAYAPIRDSNGWSIDVSVVREEFLSGTYTSIFTTVCIVAVSILVAVVVMFRLSSSIANPIKKCVERIKLLAEGDLQSPVPVFKTKDETKLLADSTKILVDGLKEIIVDETDLLGEMAKGNFNIKTKTEASYIGDFHPILQSLRDINTRLSDTLFQINLSADQVSEGSQQVSSGAGALSQGATEQASSIEELSATIHAISEQIRKNAENAQMAKEQSTQAGNQVLSSSEQMQSMISAMENISKKSSETGKIIKTIEDIAFQTNILALNAAVEAARAGSAGKGFAVVADEVRNLAGKSAGAAKNTTTLIEETMKAVDSGFKIANSTAQSMMAVVGSTKQVTGLVEKIAEASSDQSVSIGQVTQGVEQISYVVQTNSATAEESAASSEELSAQAQMLKQLVGKFQLKGNSTKLDSFSPVFGMSAAESNTEGTTKY